VILKLLGLIPKAIASDSRVIPGSLQG